MPIYEYRCSACGFEKDALQKMSEPPLVDCPNCGQAALVKLVSAAGFQLKGSGWYVTDFKSSGAKPPAGKSEKASDGSTKDGGDTKPSSESTTESTSSESKSSSDSTTGTASKPAPTSGAGD